MNYQEKVAWLGRYQTALSCQRMLEEEITVLRSDAARVTACMSGMPGRSGPDADRLPRAVEHIEDAQKRLAQQLDSCMAARMEVMRGILTVGDSAGRQVLQRRYLMGQSFAEIADAMGVVQRRSTSCTARRLSGWSRKRGREKHFPKFRREFTGFHCISQPIVVIW